ncbi:Lanthionine biosynthesis cyclase LanC [Alloactinosynnema sp. L-07]|uniref:lanthionine synthetase C family protein n=1 Tax=Alloactinosynnema sp. L-07 TaxID=1653480 RepID=UPI00065EF28F|nr:lanthionine synthetase C family protein [Alloactinosynnema sp. L-07]CRK59226.1 Lanthionine biosynthesis cyclase LanC [Alloactinosynnema sp. L-07]
MNTTDIAEVLAQRLADPTTTTTADNTHRPVPQSLANGAAGIALLHIERARTGHGSPATAHAWLTAATAQGVHRGDQAGLFHGAPALAFATNLAAQATGGYQHAHSDFAAATISITTTRLALAHARIDRGDTPALAEFDLIRGLTGLGAYHLTAHPDHPITTAVLAYLVQLAEPHPTGLPGWWTHLAPYGRRSHDYSDGHGNFGVAHGIAGPLALLAIAIREGVVVRGHIAAINRILTWLDTWQQRTPTGTWWPRTITTDELGTGRTQTTRPGPPSWCYGTPGLARAQQLAAIATNDPTRRHTAETALLDCLTDPAQADQITDAGLCHGAAGLLHTTTRIASDASVPELTSLLPDLTARLIDQLRRQPAGTELLDGSAGAALALHSLTAQPTSWDRCLLLA